MNWGLKKILKPVFDLVAAPGLGNPHTPYEAELMVAGVKPVAIMDPASVTTEMQAAINAGSIVEIATIPFERVNRIYCQPEALADAQKAADILAHRHLSPAQSSPQEQKFLTDFFGYSHISEDRQLVAIVMTSHEVEMALFRGEDHQRITDLLGGHVAALPPVLYDQQMMPNKPLEDAVVNGALSAVDIKSQSLTKVFAQSGKVEEGKELHARYYKNGEGYPVIEGKDAARRVGHLLGFTDNDLAWFTGEKYQNPLVHKVMEATRDIRQYARRQSMLMQDSP